MSAPHRTLAVAQQWVLTNILAKLPTEEPAPGFVPNRDKLKDFAPAVYTCPSSPLPVLVVPEDAAGWSAGAFK